MAPSGARPSTGPEKRSAPRAGQRLVRALREGTCDPRQQGKQAAKSNFRETVESEVFACFLGFHERKGRSFDGVLPVPKVKTEIGKKSLFYKGEFSFLPVITVSLLQGRQRSRQPLEAASAESEGP